MGRYRNDGVAAWNLAEAARYAMAASWTIGTEDSSEQQLACMLGERA